MGNTDGHLRAGSNDGCGQNGGQLPPSRSIPLPTPQSRSRCRKFPLGTCLYFSGPHSYRSLGWALQTVTSPSPSGTFLSLASLPPYFFSLRFLGRKTRKRAGRVRVDSSSLTLLAPLSPLLGKPLVQPEVVFTAAIPELSSAREPRPFALAAALSTNSSSLALRRSKPFGHLAGVFWLLGCLLTFYLRGRILPLSPTDPPLAQRWVLVSPFVRVQASRGFDLPEG